MTKIFTKQNGEIIKIEDNKYVIIDKEADINEGDWYFDTQLKKPVLGDDNPNLEWLNHTQPKRHFFKIIATINNTLKGIPEIVVLTCPNCYKGILEFVVAREPYNNEHYQCNKCDSTYSSLSEIDVKDEIKELALKEYPIDMSESERGCFDDKNAHRRIIWELGYKTAKEKFKYTDEELVKAINLARKSVFELYKIVQ